jgi:hypothetical protein
VAARLRWVTCVWVVLSVLATSPRPVRAEEAESSRYVSDQFKKLAKRIGRQYLTRSLGKVCPADQPLCPAMAEGLVRAFEAILDGDDDAAKKALTSFFVDSAVLGAVAEVLPRLEDLRAQTLPGGVSLIGAAAAAGASPTDWRKVFAPLLRCAGDALRDRRMDACKLDKAFADVLHAALDGKLGGNDVADLDAFLSHLASPRPEEVLRMLAIASTVAGRNDLRVYFFNLEYAVREGFEGGLYGFTQSFLHAPNPIIDDLARGDTVLLLAADTELGTADRTLRDGWANDAAACSADAGAAYQAFTAQRAVVATELGQAMRLGRPVSATTRALVAKLAAQRCTNGSARLLVSQAQYLHAAVTLHHMVRRHAATLLALATVLDLVRSGDQEALVRHSREIGEQLVDRLQWHVCEQVSDLATCDGLATRKVPTCEVAIARALFERRDLATVGECFLLASAVTCTSFEPTRLPAGTTQGAGGVCHVPALALTDRTQLVTLLLGVLDDAAATSDPEIRPVLMAAAKIARLAASGDPRGAIKVIARLALDAMLDKVKTVAETQLGADRERCTRKLRRSSILSGGDARCAVLLLVVDGAYEPIIEYLREGGVDGEAAATVANASYRRLLESDLLAGSPIILNVGLGVTAIEGDAWGADRYVALTVVDKFGLALVRQHLAWGTFEVGPFVGGFTDAIVRTIADEDKKYWLAGGALGVTDLGAYGLGLEMHLGWAMPFTLDKGWTDDVGVAVGAALVVPWKDYLED